MAQSNNLQVRISSDTSQFDAGIRRAQQELRTFGNIAKTAFSLVGVTSFATAIRSAVGNIANFEKANSELAAVLGTTKDGVKGLAEAAKNLGIQSKYTASEVTALQVSLSRLGFNAGQIEAMEGSVLKFATAMDTDLASAADFTGAALRAFGLDATHTGEMLDVLAASTTNSALDFGKLQTSISTVAPIAKSFGLDVKETASLLGVLANNGFDASSAATALRNILLNLSDSNGKLAKGIGHSVTNFDELIEAFKELDRKGVDVNSVLQMTDKRSAAAAITIIKQADAVSDLKVQLDGAEGSLDKMADTMQDNLIGAVNNLKSAWEGFTLKLSESAGPLATVTNGLAEFFRALAGKDSVALQQKEMEDFTKSMAANNLAATLRNGGTLSKRELGQYEQLKQEGYITPNSYQIISQGKDQQGYYNMVRRSDEFGYWGNEQREAMSASQIEAYTASIQSATTATETFTNTTKKGKTELELLVEEARAAAKEASEVAVADDEMAKAANESYEAWRRLNNMETQPFSNDELHMYAQALAEVVAYEKEWADLTDYLDYSQDALNDRLMDSFSNLEDLSRGLKDVAVSMGVTMVDALGALVGDLATGGDAVGNFANTALSAFGDMAVQVGKMMIEFGIGAAGVQLALTSLNPAVAIAAGAALVALGAAVKAGLSNVATGNYSSSAGVASGSYNAGSGDYVTRDVQVNVTGTLEADGDKLVAVLNNTANKKGYTT